MRIKVFLWIAGLLSFVYHSNGQTTPNVYNAESMSPNSAAADKMSSSPVNIYTGVPGISVPLYSYSDQNGLSFNISADYYAGGTRVAEGPSTIGVGWYMSCGGAITRTVKGAPDDISPNGFMYSANIPNDPRANSNKYYYDSLDSEQDIFQFNLGGRSGKFYITKSQQVVLVQASKMKIVFSHETGTIKKISSFTITTEDGVKYIFQDKESSIISSAQDTLFRSAYAGVTYYSAWNLSQIIAPFNTDTIKLNYIPVCINTSFNFPQSVFVKNSDHSSSNLVQPKGTNYTCTQKISSVVLPNHTTVSFIYGNTYYADNDYALSRIKIEDSIFKKGYIFDYIASAKNYKDENQVPYSTKIQLKSIQPYTATQSDKAYVFAYYGQPFSDYRGQIQTFVDSLSSATDHWGFFNEKNNSGKLIPTISGLYTGADKSINIYATNTDALHYMYPPTGGCIEYIYQNNDRLPFIKSPQNFVITNYSSTTSNGITLSQVFNSRHQFAFTVDKSIIRTDYPNFSGLCTFNYSIKNIEGDITYVKDSFSLYDLYYAGIKTWAFNLPNGNYRLDVQLTGGGTVTGSFPVNISWENKLPDNSHNADYISGLRILQIIRFNKNQPDSLPALTEEYHYVREDGKSSGFMGDIPKYDYPYRKVETISGTNYITDYTAITSEPVKTLSFTQGSPVGYSRVEVVKGYSIKERDVVGISTMVKNTGKVVYEFTDLNDANSNFNAATFPYAPQNLKEWEIGLPKRVSVYDSSGNLLQRTTSLYETYDTTYLAGENKSIKFGRYLTLYAGNSTSIPPPPKTEIYMGQEYYPASGWIRLKSIFDTTYNTDGSILASSRSYDYDTNFNVIKITSPYDRNRGLNLETRMYYPYNYTVGGKVGKLRDNGILTPVISNENWITGDANPRILSGSITNYQQISGSYIKPSAVYALETNKPVSQATIGAFDPSQLIRNSTYFKQQMSYPLFDIKGNLLQTTSTITGQSVSQIMDYNNSYSIAKVSNAAYTDIAYTSFESNGTGNWVIASGLRDTTTAALTGKRSYNLSNGNLLKSGLNTSLTYLITVWGKTASTININGISIGSSIATHNNWKLFSATVSGVSTVTISGSGLIDEVRLHPQDANMMTYTYDPIVGVTSACDANNTVLYNEYDGLNRLLVVRDNDRNILKRFSYDTAMNINVQGGLQAPIWEGVSKTCSGDGNYADSVFKDINYYSDTYGILQNVRLGLIYCYCFEPGQYPQYKIVNGICEEGRRYNTACTHIHLYDGTNFYWVWRCFYRYVWSDGSYSSPTVYEDTIDDGSNQGCQLGFIPIN